MPVGTREYLRRALIHRQRRSHVEQHQPLHRTAAIGRKAVRNARAAIMGGNVKTRMSELRHHGQRVTRHHTLAVGLVLRIGGRNGRIAVAPQIQRHDREITRQLVGYPVHMTWLCGWPCNSSSGGPLPPTRPWNSAPLQFTGCRCNAGPAGPIKKASAWPKATLDKSPRVRAPRVGMGCKAKIAAKAPAMARIFNAADHPNRGYRGRTQDAGRRLVPAEGPAAIPAAGPRPDTRCRKAPCACRGPCRDTSGRARTARDLFSVALKRGADCDDCGRR